MTQATNLNYTSSTKAVLTFAKFPNLTVLAQDYIIPSMNIIPAITPSPKLDIPRPGAKVEFSELSVGFILDENMAAWQEIQNWMVGMVAPEISTQYNAENQVSDATMKLLDSHHNVIKTLKFYDLWPSMLPEINYNQQVVEHTPIVANVMFSYMLYVVES